MFSGLGKEKTKNVQRKETKTQLVVGVKEGFWRRGHLSFLLKDEGIWAWGDGEEHSRQKAQDVKSENRSGVGGIGECLKG